MTSFDEGTELVKEYLGRTAHYPTETKGLCGLVNALIRAENTTSVPAAKIVERCAEISKFCPTDSDLLTVARDIARCDAVAAGTFDSLAGAGNGFALPDPAELRKEYGEPEAFNWKALDLDRLKKVKDREREMLRKIKAKYPGDLNWAQMADAAREFGYEDYARAWERGIH